MKRTVISFVLSIVAAGAAFAQVANPDLTRWETEAARVTIIRDDHGIPHISGKTDADVVFGMIYAQAEDDFNRVETNYLNSTGRLAEAEGESAVYRDLRQRLFGDEADMKRLYRDSPAWLRALMDAWADGLNYYLYTHPTVTPRAITRFEPWMPLTFSEGSIGGDIEHASVSALKAFYEKTPLEKAALFEGARSEQLGGSNGIAIAPAHTANKKALLLINPHTSFYFRSEAQVRSDEGLNAYGASTWGQFFVYQGFNDRIGWMHTSSGVDNIDEYVETIVAKGNDLYYRHGGKDKPLVVRKITIRYKTATGLASREFVTFRTHHGPIVREATPAEAAVVSTGAANPGPKWVSIAIMEEPLKALIQSYTRTKARNFKEYRKIMELHTNTSNNTIYADADGAIAYLHSNFVPKRDEKFDFKKPVDGSNPATDWQGVHGFDESPNVVNPTSGWVYNSNNWPYSAAGADSPKREAFPAYMDRVGENPRGIHAIRVLTGKNDFTLDSLVAAAYDSYLTAFADIIPPLIKAWDDTPADDPVKVQVAEAITLLRGWDFRYSAASVPTSLAEYWGGEMWGRCARSAMELNTTVYAYIVTKTTAAQKLESLAAAMARLKGDFGSWNTPWGEINRVQRLTGDIDQRFDDLSPSFPVAFSAARWGSLAALESHPYPNTKKWYGAFGNSFVAVVEFGEKLRARAVMAGGQSSDPKSPHFKDQIEAYATGRLREVYFYKEQLAGHTERTYHPGK